MASNAPAERQPAQYTPYRPGARLTQQAQQKCQSPHDGPQREYKPLQPPEQGLVSSMAGLAISNTGPAQIQGAATPNSVPEFGTAGSRRSLRVIQPYRLPGKSESAQVAPNSLPTTPAPSQSVAKPTAANQANITASVQQPLSNNGHSFPNPPQTNEPSSTALGQDSQSQATTTTALVCDTLQTPGPIPVLPPWKVNVNPYLNTQAQSSLVPKSPRPAYPDHEGLIPVEKPAPPDHEGLIPVDSELEFSSPLFPNQSVTSPLSPSQPTGNQNISQYSPIATSSQPTVTQCAQQTQQPTSLPINNPHPQVNQITGQYPPVTAPSPPPVMQPGQVSSQQTQPAIVAPVPKPPHPQPSDGLSSPSTPSLGQTPVTPSSPPPPYSPPLQSPPQYPGSTGSVAVPPATIACATQGHAPVTQVSSGPYLAAVASPAPGPNPPPLPPRPATQPHVYPTTQSQLPTINVPTISVPQTPMGAQPLSPHPGTQPAPMFPAPTPQAAAVGPYTPVAVSPRLGTTTPQPMAIPQTIPPPPQSTSHLNAYPVSKLSVIPMIPSVSGSMSPARPATALGHIASSVLNRPDKWSKKTASFLGEAIKFAAATAEEAMQVAGVHRHKSLSARSPPTYNYALVPVPGFPGPQPQPWPAPVPGTPMSPVVPGPAAGAPSVPGVPGAPGPMMPQR